MGSGQTKGAVKAMAVQSDSCHFPGTPPDSRSAFTLVEMLVAIAVIGILIGLLLPAVQAARESARRTECQHHLRQLAMAFQLHEDVHRHLPTNGWGWAWMGDARRGFGVQQPGGWCFNVLPYIEQGVVRDMARGGLSSAQMQETVISVFYCPSRRAVRIYPYTQRVTPLRNSMLPNEACKTDYAVCAGDKVIDTPPGPPTDSPSDLNRYRWPPLDDATGISYVRSLFRMADIRDGTAYQIVVGEKYITSNWYAGNGDLGDDQSAFIGDDADNRRWTESPPERDGELPGIQKFGSPHTTGAYFAMADGSVRLIRYAIDAEVFRRLGNRRDGRPAAIAD
ncbi:MAG: prepilin-type N-terminal cleavage/methylation domain-containing protein [Pirellulaceae bacterium]|nr:MAG: prepilin-type N-terminal cleavage/methylation domain-containing protein [Pirellulaceae bacterium]